MDTETTKRWHKRLLLIWAGPGLCVSILLALFTSQKVVLVWNLAVSIYTILMEHFLGWRQEKKEQEDRSEERE
jgi:hypothetical protein